ncbi:uncharacterized protein LOC108704843 isoform X1 [Xenopus laevis]|uniref:Uncharacterized protein LOC108704843 isoform X1 n=1 Tax=Xenopus laevis TaxID=8355 RepID=A0A8J1KYQ9_XENLA|nr:uncharacterized protein LOC108704843 isoform X1 [Xenopus laevis]XP_041422446.1 uncharacterized protein LOC108704843 isoform X1 [Xenopus laevis]
MSSKCKQKHGMAHIKAQPPSSLCDSSFPPVITPSVTSTSQMSLQISLNGSAKELTMNNNPIDLLVDSASPVSTPGIGTEDGKAKFLEAPLHDNMTNPNVFGE